MHVAWRRLLLVLVLGSPAAAGCRTRMLDEPDSQPADASSLPFDEAVVVDLERAPDLVRRRCRTHELAPVAFESFLPVQLPGARIGPSLLLRLGFPLRADCDVAGPLEVSAQPGFQATVTATQQVWKGTVDCGAPVIAYRTLVIEEPLVGAARTVNLRDGAPGANRVISLSFGSRIATNCADARALDTTCDGDCQCRATNASSRCVRFPDAVWRCALPCSSDVDCRGADGQTPLRCDATARLCVRCMPPDCGCTSDGDCPFGQGCGGGSCSPLAGPLDTACTCDADCPAGRLCTGMGRCLAACSSAKDCPLGAATCEGGACR